MAVEVNQSVRARGLWERGLWEGVRNQSLFILLYLIVTSLVVRERGVVEVLGWSIGVFLGWWLLLADHVLDVFWIENDTEMSGKALSLAKAGEWRELLNWLYRTSELRQRLVMHSVVFEVLLLILGVYVATTGENFFVKGVVLGLWGKLVYDQVKQFYQAGNLGRWLWQVKDTVPQQLQSAITFVGVLIWFVLTLLGLGLLHQVFLTLFLV